MSQPEWLSLMEYSNKYNLSLSTIRRRIKNSQLEFRLSGGKYFILDDGHNNKNLEFPVLEKNLNFKSSYDLTKETERAANLFISDEYNQSAKELSFIEDENKNPKAVLNDLDQVMYVAQKYKLPSEKVLEELKNTYQMILNEKAQQIMDLKKENNDLSTLVKVLEDEIERLKNKSNRIITL